jgi:hypothetical protein
MRADWGRETAFYARFRITQQQFRIGVPSVGGRPAVLGGDRADVDAMSR